MFSTPWSGPRRQAVRKRRSPRTSLRFILDVQAVNTIRFCRRSGTGNSILRSSLPGRSRAGSSVSARFVAMMTCPPARAMSAAARTLSTGHPGANHQDKQQVYILPNGGQVRANYCNDISPSGHTGRFAKSYVFPRRLMARTFGRPASTK